MAIIQTETRKIVQEETRKIVKEELEPVKRDIQTVKKDIVKIRKNINTVINFSDVEYLELRKRIEKIEEHLHISALIP